MPKISNIATKSSQYFDSTNRSKIVLNLNFNIKLIELLIEPQIVAELIVQLIDRSYFWDIGHPYLVLITSSFEASTICVIENLTNPTTE